MVEIPIAVLHDTKERIGVTNEWGFLYRVDQDSLLGDGVYDALCVLEREHPFDNDDQKKRWDAANRMLENEGLDLIGKDHDSAARLKRACAEFFSNQFNLSGLKFSIIYFDSLNDAEQNDLVKAVIY